MVLGNSRSEKLRFGARASSIYLKELVILPYRKLYVYYNYESLISSLWTIIPLAPPTTHRRWHVL